MDSSIVSYHIPNNIKSFIDEEAKKSKLPKGKFLGYFIENYKRISLQNSELKSYFDMAEDKDFLLNQIKESEVDLLTEINLNEKTWTE